ncbi:hypothetical protein AtEden1_Chr3g0191821 [Arabidopsis thaliana]
MQRVGLTSLLIRALGFSRIRKLKRRVDISIDSLSDHRRSRAPDGSSECSGADRFRAESLDDDLVEAGHSSSGSSSQTSVVAELRRRISSPLVDRAETSATTTTTFKPRLTDEEIGDEDFKEAIASGEIAIFEPRSAVGGGFEDDVEEMTVSDEIGIFPAVSGPKPGSADYLGPTKTSASSMNTALRFCNASRGLVARVPETHERPWTTPVGYMCVYEKFLTECGLSFPIPIFLLGFVARRKMALSQLTVAAIRYAVGLIRLAEQCGVEVRRSHYEEVINLKRIGGVRPGFYYVQSATKPKIITGVKNKTNDWCFEYFFVKVTKESVGDYELVDLSEWRMTPGSLISDVKFFYFFFPYVWPTGEEKERLSLHKPKKARKTPAKRKMKMNTEEVGSYSSRYKRQKTSAPKEFQEKDCLPSGEDRTARSAEEERRAARSEPPRGHQGRSVVNPGSSVDRSKETREKELAAVR